MIINDGHEGSNAAGTSNQLRGGKWSFRSQNEWNADIRPQ